MRIALLIFDYLEYHLEFQGYGVAFDADIYGDGCGQGEESCVLGDGWGDGSDEGYGDCRGDGYSESKGLVRYVIKFQTRKGGNLPCN